MRETSPKKSPRESRIANVNNTSPLTPHPPHPLQLGGIDSGAQTFIHTNQTSRHVGRKGDRGFTMRGGADHE